MKKTKRIFSLLLALLLSVSLLPFQARADKIDDANITIKILWNDQGNVHQDRPERLLIYIMEDELKMDGEGSKLVTAEDHETSENVWSYTFTVSYYDTAENWFAQEFFPYEWEEKNTFPNTYEGKYYNMELDGNGNGTLMIQYDRLDVHSYTEEVAEGPYFKEDSTCTTPYVYWKSCLCGKESTTDTFTYGDTDPTAHDWGDFQYTWADDYSTCTATRVCAHNAEHVQTSTVNSISQVTQEQTCTLPELTEYKAHTFNLSGALLQTKSNVQTKPAAGHDWGEVQYIWRIDGAGGRNCTAQRVCATDTDHRESETVNGTAQVTQQQGCTQSEITTYTAHFTNPAFEDQRFDLPTSPIAGHNWGEPTYTWAADYSTCTATRICQNDSDHAETETADSTAHITQAKTCTLPELTSYTAAFTNAVFATQTLADVETATATDHNWGEPTYTWAADYSTCTATRICQNDSDHVEIETADSTAQITQAKTCTLPELTAYTAVFTNGVFATQTQADVETAVAINHAWSEPSYTWAADYSTCTATRICQNDSDHVETETADSTAQITQAKTCTLPELTAYTAVFTNGVFATQTLADVETATATDHNWSEPSYTWAADYSTCTATRICQNDSDHVETETADSTAQITQAKTCTLPELTTYTAVFTNAVFATQTQADVETATATDHNWDEPTYTWATDYSTCTATRICQNDSDHVETETADSTAQVTQEGTDTLPELTTYTATFENTAFAAQTKTDVKTTDPGQPDPDQPDPDQPNSDQPDSDQPDPDQPDSDQPDSDQPDTDQPDTDQPDSDQPDPDQPDPDQPNPDQPDPGQPDPDQPDPDQPDSDQPDAAPPDAAPPTAETDIPHTGDPNHMGLWITQMALAGTALALLLFLRKRKAARSKN